MRSEPPSNFLAAAGLERSLKNQKPKYTLIPLLSLIQGTKDYKSFTLILNYQRKKTKKHPLTKEDKKFNKDIASGRVLNENVIAMTKRFKIVSDRYRNRRKRFGLRFNLIAAIYNLEIVT
jgi:hypothetical protein